MKFLVPLAAGFTLAAARVSYDGYKVFRVDTKNDLAGVEKQISDLRKVNFNPGTSDHIDIGIAHDDVEAFEKLGLDAEVLHKDLGSDIKAEGDLKPYTRKADLPDMEWFDSYHAYEDHIAYLEDLHDAFPDNSELLDAGESYEGRSIQGIHFWGEGGSGSKPAVYWHGTVHAREWITTMTLEYIMHQLISGYLDDDEEVKTLVDSYDFYIFPVVNPDGFVYTQEEDRMWRKNRQPRSSARCVGTDVNRNWPHFWDVEGGASNDPCQETFRGLSEGDTPEMAALVNMTETVAAANSEGIKFYADWHSYSQYILLPYGGDCDARVDNYDKQMELAGLMAEEIEAVHGSAYTYGPVCDMLYAASGGSMDYVYDISGAEISWGLELRPRSGLGGFVLPPEQILPTGEETWAGVKAVLQEM